MIRIDFEGVHIMTIVYEVKDLFKLLWTNKKIIIIVTIFCGLFAVPIATLSYNAALDDYTRLMQKAIRGEEESPILGTATCFVKLQIPKENTLSAKVIKSNTVALMNQDIITKWVWDTIKKDDKVKYTDFKSSLTITEMKGISLIQIQHGSIQEDTFSLFVDQLIKRTVKLVPEIINASIELKKENMFFVPYEKVDKLDINEIILQPPSKPHNYIKIIGTAGLAGILFVCFIILLLDFLKPSIKSKEDLINNYSCNILSMEDVVGALIKASISKTSILPLTDKLDTAKLEKELKEHDISTKTLSKDCLCTPEITEPYLILVKPFITYHRDLINCIDSLPVSSSYSIVIL